MFKELSQKGQLLLRTSQHVHMIKNIVLYILLLFSLNCRNKNDKNTSLKATPAINYSLVKSFPHDTNSFVEGLFYHDGNIFESTGSPAELPQTNSLFGILDTITGKISHKAVLNKAKYFGEGISYLNGKIYQLTYLSNTGFVYDSKNYKKISEFNFANKEGWGLTTDGRDLIMSDGTSNLTFISPHDFSVQKVVNVFDINGEVVNLNELEFVNGYIYANIFTTDRIAKIDPVSGEVVGLLDLSSLSVESKNLHKKSLELNGIAYDSLERVFFVTGKMWPKIYKISFPH